MAAFDARSNTVLFMFQSGADAYLMTTPGDNGTGWSAPRLVIHSQKQEREHRPIFPGPGNALVLSATHPTHPHRIIFPGPSLPPSNLSILLPRALLFLSASFCVSVGVVIDCILLQFGSDLTEKPRLRPCSTLTMLERASNKPRQPGLTMATTRAPQ